MPEGRRNALALLQVFWQRYPLRSLLVLLSLLVAGLAEGLGIVTLLPLLQLTLEPETAGTAGSMARWFHAAFAALGLPLGIGSLLLLIVISLFLKAGLTLLAMRNVGYSVAHVTTDLRLELIQALLEARWPYFAGQPVGRFANAVSSEASRAASAYMATWTLIAGLLQVLVYLGFALLLSWQLTLAALLVGGLIVVLLGGFVRMARRAGEEQTSLLNALSARLTDALQGIKPLKAMGLERYLRPLLERETEGLNRALQRQVMSKWSLTVSQEPVMGIFLALGLYVALSVMALPMSVLLVTAVLFTRTVSRIGSLQKVRQNIAVQESAFWSLRELIEEARRQREQTPAGPVPELVREVTLEGVGFGYDPQSPLLQGVDLCIPAGSFTGLIGPSGAGKTTIADLIAGLQQPDEGRVCVDGRPLDSCDIHGWRNRIGYVPQELILFHDTVRRNITLGDPALDDDHVWQALEDADARDFVEGLEQGLDTVIGERGIRLSGGQRQRLAIARALVRRPRLLILDEATTALDPATEAEVCRTLRALAPAVTVLAISHQPRLVESADRLYRIEGGRLRDVTPAGPERHVRTR